MTQHSYNEPYSKKSDAFFVIEQKPGWPVGNELNLHRVQFIPWNEPQHEQHAVLINQHKAGRIHVQIDDKVVLPELGPVDNHILYYNRKKLHRSGDAVKTPTPDDVAQTIGLFTKNILHVTRDAPDKATIAALRAAQGLPNILETTDVLGLVDDPQQAIGPLVFSRIRLVAKGSLDVDRRLKPLVLEQGEDATAFAPFVGTIYAARLPTLGTASVFERTVDSPEFYQALCQDALTIEPEYKTSEGLRLRKAEVLGNAPAAWQDVASQVAYRNAHVFDAWPPARDVQALIARHGLGAAAKTFN